jgi:hypothetical protein
MVPAAWAVVRLPNASYSDVLQDNRPPPSILDIRIEFELDITPIVETKKGLTALETAKPLLFL